VDTANGVLDWSLRCDDRVVVWERTNAMHVRLPEVVDLVTVDVGWTRQNHILPNAVRQAKRGGTVLSLFKPQYEATRRDLRAGRLVDGRFDAVLAQVIGELALMGIAVAGTVRLPHEPRRKNPEAFLCVPVPGPSS
jgi:23S rRNA (cytidine1920-2'-O)/16S rRNA (cytidine1409-2'-O)-methyltransferase